MVVNRGTIIVVAVTKGRIQQGDTARNVRSCKELERSQDRRRSGVLWGFRRTLQHWEVSGQGGHLVRASERLLSPPGVAPRLLREMDGSDDLVEDARPHVRIPLSILRAVPRAHLAQVRTDDHAARAYNPQQEARCLMESEAAGNRSAGVRTQRGVETIDVEGDVDARGKSGHDLANHAVPA